MIVTELPNQEDVKEEERDYEVTSVIDFGDSQVGYSQFSASVFNYFY